MSSVTKYMLYGPRSVLRRFPAQLTQAHPPKYTFKYESDTNPDVVCVLVYEEYEKQTNSTVSLIVVAEFKDERTRVHVKKAGGVLGFRGSSLREERNIESGVIEFIMDFTTRYGLSLQSDTTPEETDERDA